MRAAKWGSIEFYCRSNHDFRKQYGTDHGFRAALSHPPFSSLLSYQVNNH